MSATSNQFPGPDATREEIAAFFEARGLDKNGNRRWIAFNGWNCNGWCGLAHEKEE